MFLIDVSGSMQSNDKLPMLKTGLMNLVDLLNPDDRISIITYSGRELQCAKQTRLRLPFTSLELQEVLMEARH